MKKYATKSALKRVIEFTLDDEVYHFTVPKQAGVTLGLIEASSGSGSEGDQGLKLAAVTFDWLGDGLPEDEHDRIIARLRDPADDLDFDVLTEIVADLMAESAERPTKPQLAS